MTLIKQVGTQKLAGYQKVTLDSNIYDPGCPTRMALDLIADKWTALIVGLLEEGPRRFAWLSREIGGISQKMLTQTLRHMERDGLVMRTVYAEVPPRVEYELTPLGQTLQEPLKALRVWAADHINSVITAQQHYDGNQPPPASSPEIAPLTRNAR